MPRVMPSANVPMTKIGPFALCCTQDRRARAACVGLEFGRRGEYAASMPRYALKIEYDGAPFAGWQRQKDQPSVQGAIEAALAKLEPRAHTIAAAGRTDAGVHGLAQVAHCDLERGWQAFRLSEALNYHLKPAPVAIVDCAIVEGDWHARFFGGGAAIFVPTGRAPCVDDPFARAGLACAEPAGRRRDARGGCAFGWPT